MIGIAIGTYGDTKVWNPLADRAVMSVHKQTYECAYEHVHGDSLADARNRAADRLIARGCDWLVFLDADDELHYRFTYHMHMRARELVGVYPVYRPSTQCVVDGVAEPPYLLPEKPILQQNFMPIGCMHRVSMFTTIGGFDEWPVLEDWAYWIKAAIVGATFLGATGAVYRAHSDSTRQHRNVTNDAHTATAIEIRKRYRKQAEKAGLV